jgi:hypothetical protein
MIDESVNARPDRIGGNAQFFGDLAEWRAPVPQVADNGQVGVIRFHNSSLLRDGQISCRIFYQLSNNFLIYLQYSKLNLRPISRIPMKVVKLTNQKKHQWIVWNVTGPSTSPYSLFFLT